MQSRRYFPRAKLIVLEINVTIYCNLCNIWGSELHVCEFSMNSLPTILQVIEQRSRDDWGEGYGGSKGEIYKGPSSFEVRLVDKSYQ